MSTETTVASAASQLTFAQPTDATGEATAVAQPLVVLRGKLDKFGTAMGTGRRKTAVARVRVRKGTGKFEVNGRPMAEYFCVERDRVDIVGPLKLADNRDQLDVWVRVEGGGTTGQTGAVIMGLARALEVLNPSLHQSLAEHGFLTRDSRMVERKKYGHKKARRSFQFSKR